MREGGDARGKPIGVLAVHFDWEPQARAIVQGVRLTPEEAARTRVMLVDAKRKIIAASDGEGFGSEFPLETRPRERSCTDAAGGLSPSTSPPATKPIAGSAAVGSRVHRFRKA